jgi:periplasmic divalent cation tolerance protein
MTQFRLIYVTTKDAGQAREIAEILLNERRIACANIIPKMQSLYWWQDRIQTDEEAVLILKTQAWHVPQIIERVKKLHSYDCPCVISIPIETGSEEYLNWLEQESTLR